MPLTPIAERDTKIAFERLTMERSQLGPDKPGTPELIEKAWAKVRYGTSQERRDGAATAAAQVATFRVPASARLRGVTPEDHRITVFSVAGGLVRGASEWNITGGPVPAAGGAELEFTAVQVRG